MTEVLCCWCSMAVWQTLLSVPVHGPQCWQKQTFMLAHQVIMFCLIKSLCAVSLTVHMPLEGVDVTFFILCTAFGFFCGLSPTDSNMVWQFNHWHGNSIIVNRSHGNCHLQCTCCWPMWAEIVICSVPVADLCEQKLSFAVYLLLTYVSRNCHLQCTCCWPMWAEIVICSVPVADLCEQKLSFAVYLLLAYVSRNCHLQCTCCWPMWAANTWWPEL